MYSLEDWAKTGFSFDDLIALKGFQKEPSDELKQYLKEKTGLSYEEIPMGEINKIFPGIYDNVFLSQIPTVIEIYKDIREKVFG